MLVVINDKALIAEKIVRLETREIKNDGMLTYKVVALVKSFNNYTQEVPLNNFYAYNEALSFMNEAANKINEVLKEDYTLAKKIEIIETYIDGDINREIYDWILNVLPTFLEDLNSGETPEWENNQLKVCGIKIEKDPDRDFLTLIGEKDKIEYLINAMRDSYLEAMRTQFDDMFPVIRTIYERGEECL